MKEKIKAIIILILIVIAIGSWWYYHQKTIDIKYRACKEKCQGELYDFKVRACEAECGEKYAR